MGKSNVSTNLAIALAQQGRKVCVFDADTSLANINILLDIQPQLTLEHLLLGSATIDQVIVQGPGGISIVPAASGIAEFAQLDLHQQKLLLDALLELEKRFDYLLIDTHPGLNEETLLSVAISNMLIVLLRPDQQDFQGSAVTLDVARKLDVQNVRLVVNKVPTRFDAEALQRDISELFKTPVVAAMSLSEDVAAAGSGNIFSAVYPEHPWSAAVHAITNDIITVLSAPQGDSQQR